ncbi:MAG: hypothetical protein KDD78_12590 [Caldilineaceae bacterium]|nr:hypothetical protein [Caldilineaceae bacterium]
MPCLFALLGAIAPRLALFFLWIFTPIVNLAFRPWPGPAWIWALPGLIFFPLTTLLYSLMAATGDMTIWSWLIVFLAMIMDLGTYGNTYNQRDTLRG